MTVKLTLANSPYKIDPAMLGPQLPLQPGVSLYLSGGNGGNIVIIFPKVSDCPAGYGTINISFEDDNTGIEIKASGTDVFAGVAAGISSGTYNAPLANPFVTGRITADASTTPNRWVIEQGF